MMYHNFPFPVIVEGMGAGKTHSSQAQIYQKVKMVATVLKRKRREGYEINIQIFY
jgi:hypothetical protein